MKRGILVVDVTPPAAISVNLIRENKGEMEEKFLAMVDV